VNRTPPHPKQFDKIKYLQAIYFVGIDVGGTNTRVAVSKADSLALIQLVKFQANTISHLVEGLKAVGNQLIQVLHRRPQAAVLAVAGPVTDNGKKVHAIDISVLKIHSFARLLLLTTKELRRSEHSLLLTSRPIFSLLMPLVLLMTWRALVTVLMLLTNKDALASHSNPCGKTMLREYFRAFNRSLALM